MPRPLSGVWGECPSRGWFWRGLKETKKPLNIQKWCQKRAVFRTDLLKKNAENSIFYSKVLSKIYFQDALEEYMNFTKIFYLKELSHEIEMGCLWYGWKEPYLEMNL
jgi:hypothetical protein